MKVTVEIDNLPDDDSETLADALDAVAERVAARGYTDAEPDRTTPEKIGTEHGCRLKFTISRR